jgi:hypothetical protein
MWTLTEGVAIAVQPSRCHLRGGEEGEARRGRRRKRREGRRRIRERRRRRDGAAAKCGKVWINQGR